jgi:DNA-binding NarL/FixJ family response regulator
MAGTTGICGRVLIADDDMLLLDLLESALHVAGYETVRATSGDEAIRVADLEHVGAAVIDVNLPGCSGYEVCRKLRHLQGAALPIVFVSGERTEAYDRIGGLLLGADDYLVKPFDPGELVARLDGIVRRANPVAARRELTRRELEILRLLADGLGQIEISVRLEITSKTVATHIERILGKLGVRSRAQAVALAYRETLVVL